MKTLVAGEYGGANVLRFEERSVPQPKSDELLVRVKATTVNRTDTGVLSGKPAFARLVFGLLRPKREIPGTEFAGVVEAAGQSRNDYQVGDRVFGFHDEGTLAHAEYLTVTDREAVAIIPEGISFETAAACSEGPFYATNLLKHVEVGEKSRVLINGVSGSIGSALLQLVKLKGAFVVGVCSAEAAPKLLELGADVVHDYQTTDFREVEKEPFDFIIDTVGNHSYRDCRQFLTKRGTYGSTELGSWYQNAFFAIGSKLTGLGHAIFPIPRDVKGCQRDMLELIADGKYRPLIDRNYPFEKIIDAYRYVECGKKTGNVVVNMSG